MFEHLPDQREIYLDDPLRNKYLYSCCSFCLFEGEVTVLWFVSTSLFCVGCHMATSFLDKRISTALYNTMEQKIVLSKNGGGTTGYPWTHTKKQQNTQKNKSLDKGFTPFPKLNAHLGLCPWSLMWLGRALAPKLPRVKWQRTSSQNRCWQGWVRASETEKWIP